MKPLREIVDSGKKFLKLLYFFISWALSLPSLATSSEAEDNYDRFMGVGVICFHLISSQ